MIIPGYSISDQGRAITSYEETPLMPTYLFAFVISDFVVNSKTSVNNILLRVFSRPEQIENTYFGLETAENALQLFETSFETEYELGKLDQVALPVFNRSGMENYGIVFYREDYLLYDPSVSVSEKLFRVAIIKVYRLMPFHFVFAPKG